MNIEEGVKNRLIIILAVLCIIFFISTVSSCGSSVKEKQAFNKEMASRMDLEEKISKFTQEKGVFEAKLAAANQALEEQKTAAENAKKSLIEEQMINQSLKDELQKITKAKDALEADLRKGKSDKSKR